jgi:predicted MFS family arabinose efflux permease
VLASVLLPFALAHFISYLYRSVNTVVYPDLVRDIGLTANTLGLLTGVYFIAFAAAQLPVGMALDRFGPRKVQVPMLAVAALGGALFAQAQTFEGLLVARALIGLGVSASLMAAIKASSLWLPPGRLPLATAVLLAVGGLGAMVSTAPLQLALDAVGWRHAFWGIAAGAAGVSLLIFSAVPEHAARPPQVSVRAMAKSIGQLYASALFWRMALCTLFANAAYMAVQGLWIGPWLRDVGHLSRPEVAGVLFWGTVAMVAGSLSFGWLTDRLGRYRVRPITVCGLGMSVFLLFEALMLLGTAVPPAVLAIGFSFFGTAGAMNYAILAQTMPAHLTGRVSTCFNLLIFVAAFGLQWGLGAILNAWTPTGGQYPEIAYRTALGVSLALQLPGLVLWLGFKPWQRRDPRHPPSTGTP